MNNDETKDYASKYLPIIASWHLKGARSSVLLCILFHINQEQKEKVKITINDFINFTHYSRQPIIDAIQYLVTRSIIERERYTDNKSFLYSIIEYDVEGERIEGMMKSYKKKSGYSSWKDAPASKDSKEKSERFWTTNVDEWNNDDFGYFTKAFTKHAAKKILNTDVSDIAFIFGRSWRQNLTITDIIDYLDKRCGHHFCKLLLKAYIEWWVCNKFVEVRPHFKDLNGKKRFLMGSLKTPRHMDEFLEEHGITKDIQSVEDVEAMLSSYQKSIKNGNNKDKKKKYIHRTSKEDMDRYFNLGLGTLLSECGIVLSGNYLMQYHGKGYKEAASYIGKYLADLNLDHGPQRATLKRICDVTCEGSPYLNTMKFLSWYKVYERIINKLGDDLDLTDFKVTKKKSRNSYNFLVDREMVTT